MILDEKPLAIVAGVLRCERDDLEHLGIASVHSEEEVRVTRFGSYCQDLWIKIVKTLSHVGLMGPLA